MLEAVTAATAARVLFHLMARTKHSEVLAAGLICDHIIPRYCSYEI